MEDLRELVSLVADLAAIVAVVGLAMNWWRLHDRVEAWHRAHRLYMDTATPAMRASIFRYYDSALPFDEWPDEDKQTAWFLCGVLEEVCFYRRAIGRDFWPTFGFPVGKIYLLLQPAISASRHKDHRLGKWKFFESVGRSALKRFPEIERCRGARASGSIS